MDTCPYCGGKMGRKQSKEHMVPKSLCNLAGINKCDTRNITHVHSSCNQIKGSLIYIPSCLPNPALKNMPRDMLLKYVDFLYENIDAIIRVWDEFYTTYMITTVYEKLQAGTLRWDISTWKDALIKFKKLYESGYTDWT